MPPFPRDPLHDFHRHFPGIKGEIPGEIQAAAIEVTGFLRCSAAYPRYAASSNYDRDIFLSAARQYRPHSEIIMYLGDKPDPFMPDSFRTNQRLAHMYGMAVHLVKAMKTEMTPKDRSMLELRLLYPLLRDLGTEMVRTNTHACIAPTGRQVILDHTPQRGLGD